MTRSSLSPTSPAPDFTYDPVTPPPASRLHPASGAPIPPPGYPRCPLRDGDGYVAVHAHEDGDRRHRGCRLEPTFATRVLGWLRR